MRFEQFIQYSLNGGGGSMMELSKLKRENAVKYEQYRQRLNRVADWHERRQADLVREGKLREPLTAENFLRIESTMIVINGIVGDISADNSLTARFHRLTPQAKRDIRYHAILCGRAANDGTNKVELAQEDFDFLESADYHDLVKWRAEEAAKNERAELV